MASETKIGELERLARSIAARKMGLTKHPDGSRLPDELWRQALPEAEAIAASSEQKSALKAVLEVLDACEDYFDQRQDADHDGTGFVPNEEMRLLLEVRETLTALRKASGEPALSAPEKGNSNGQ